MKKTVILIMACLVMSGCATMEDVWKRFLGKSTAGIEEYRKEARVKIITSGYDACYADIEKSLGMMETVSVYAKNKDMIAVYYVEVNTTPVGIFFKSIDKDNTQVEVSSPSVGARDIVADFLFLGIKREKK